MSVLADRESPVNCEPIDKCACSKEFSALDNGPHSVYPQMREREIDREKETERQTEREAEKDRYSV